MKCIHTGIYICVRVIGYKYPYVVYGYTHARVYGLYIDTLF